MQVSVIWRLVLCGLMLVQLATNLYAQAADPSQAPGQPVAPQPDLRIALSPRKSAPPTTVPSPRVYFLCFDTAFATREEAEYWSVEVHLAFRERYEHYLLQKKKNSQVSFAVCLGTFSSENHAKDTQKILADALKRPTHIKFISMSVL